MPPLENMGRWIPWKGGKGEGGPRERGTGRGGGSIEVLRPGVADRRLRDRWERSRFSTRFLGTTLRSERRTHERMKQTTSKRRRWRLPLDGASSFAVREADVFTYFYQENGCLRPPRKTLRDFMRGKLSKKVHAKKVCTVSRRSWKLGRDATYVLPPKDSQKIPFVTRIPPWKVLRNRRSVRGVTGIQAPSLG